MFSNSKKLKQELNELKQELSYLKGLVQGSMGNKGVQTDTSQTHPRQPREELGTTKNQANSLGTTTNKDQDLEAIDVINLMNDFKGSLKNKFKSLTDQEFFVFSIIYSLEEHLGAVSYKNIAEKAGISQSSVRDHVRNLLNKGIQLEKEKANNKTVLLKISPELKSLVSFDSLIQIQNPYKNRIKNTSTPASLIIKN